MGDEGFSAATTLEKNPKARRKRWDHLRRNIQFGWTQNRKIMFAEHDYGDGDDDGDGDGDGRRRGKGERNQARALRSRAKSLFSLGV